MCLRNIPRHEKNESKIGYVLLWFPLSSETFIFREIVSLQKLHLPINVYTLYGKKNRGCSKAMQNYGGPIKRMGLKSFFSVLFAFAREFFKRPVFVCSLMRKSLFCRMRNLETLGENTWCFFGGFLLAENIHNDNIKLLHAPWANGPATAAWVASQLTGIPYGFTGRAGDIYPPDGLLAEKIRDAKFLRTNNQANINWLSQFCSPVDKQKLHLIYNGLPTKNLEKTKFLKNSPFKILSIGRFARTKGFPYLLTALARLKRENVNFKLTLIGDGYLRRRIENLCKKLNLGDNIEMPGFIPNDQIEKHLLENDVLVVPSVIYKNGDRDGIPNVIMEASMAGLPVIATDVCGISEVIETGNTGYLVPEKNSQALANAIRNCMENYEYSISMASMAQKRVFKMFNPEINASKLKELYQNAIINERR